MEATSATLLPIRSFKLPTCSVQLALVGLAAVGRTLAGSQARSLPVTSSSLLVLHLNHQSRLVHPSESKSQALIYPGNVGKEGEEVKEARRSTN